MLTHLKKFSLNTNLIIKVVCFSFPLNETPLLVWVSSLPWTWVFHKEEGEILRWWVLSVILGNSSSGMDFEGFWYVEPEIPEWW